MIDRRGMFIEIMKSNVCKEDLVAKELCKMNCFHFNLNYITNKTFKEEKWITYDL